MPRFHGIHLLMILGAASIQAQVAPPQVPDSLKPPPSEAVLLRALGKGKQIYACQANPADAMKFEWVLEKPEADLLDAQGKKIGSHYEGPTWQATDGSKVIGEVQQRAQSPRAGAIPWLLLKAKTNQGTGVFARVTFVQRVDTVGGAAPADGCNSGRAGKELVIEYQATYYFYAARP